MVDLAVATPPPSPESDTPPAPAKEASKDAAPAPTTTAAEIRKLKLALGDKSFELPEEDVIALASANGKALYESTQAKRDLEAHLAKLKTNWRDVLKEQGVDVRAAILEEFAKELESQADEETLTPEAKELKALKAQLAEKEAAEKRAKEDAEKATHEAKKEEAKAKLKATLEEAIKVGGLSNSNFTRRMLVEKLRFNSANGLPIHPTVLAAEVREEMAENFDEWLQGLSVEQVWAATEKFPEFRKEFVKRYAQLKGAKSTPKPPPAPAAKPEAKKRGAIVDSLRLAEAFKRGIG